MPSQQPETPVAATGTDIMRRAPSPRITDISSRDSANRQFGAIVESGPLIPIGVVEAPRLGGGMTAANVNFEGNGNQEIRHVEEHNRLDNRIDNRIDNRTFNNNVYVQLHFSNPQHLLQQLAPETVHGRPPINDPRPEPPIPRRNLWRVLRRIFPIGRRND